MHSTVTGWGLYTSSHISVNVPIGFVAAATFTVASISSWVSGSPIIRSTMSFISSVFRLVATSL